MKSIIIKYQAKVTEIYALGMPTYNCQTTIYTYCL